MANQTKAYELYTEQHRKFNPDININRPPEGSQRDQLISQLREAANNEKNSQASGKQKVVPLLDLTGKQIVDPSQQSQKI